MAIKKRYVHCIIYHHSFYDVLPFVCVCLFMCANHSINTTAHVYLYIISLVSTAYNKPVEGTTTGGSSTSKTREIGGTKGNEPGANATPMATPGAPKTATPVPAQPVKK